MVTKARMIQALQESDVPDDCHIKLGDDPISYIPDIVPVCGSGQEFMPYYCVLPPGHEGQCYCQYKGVDFDKEETT